MEKLISFIWKLFIFFMERRMERRNMPKKDGVNIRGNFLNFLNFSVAEIAAATYRELELDTNMSAERGLMMEIHSVELFRDIGDFTELAAGASESLHFHLARESKSAMIQIDNKDCVFGDTIDLNRSAAIGTDAGPLYFRQDRYSLYSFPMPIPYVKPSIFVAVQGTDASALETIRGRIGYTLREIDREDFLSLLVAIQ